MVKNKSRCSSAERLGAGVKTVKFFFTVNPFESKKTVNCVNPTKKWFFGFQYKIF